MEAKYQSLSIFEFQQKFPNEDACKQFLVEKKWGAGFSCSKCGHGNYCKGSRPHDRQCSSCNYIESPTAGTVFHKVKIPLVKAFYIVYYLSTSKKGISSTELSRKLGMGQKTCWLFKRKVMEAMKSSGRYPMTGMVEVDEFVIGGQETGVRGRKNNKKRLVVLAIERKGKGASRMYAKSIPAASAKHLETFMKAHIQADASIRTDGWSGYGPLRKEFTHLVQEKSESKGQNFAMLHRVIMGFKGWLRGIHHHAVHLQAYLDEYCFRFNRSFMKEGAFENLLDRMMVTSPKTYEQLREPYCVTT